MQELRGETPFHCIITGPTNCGKSKYVTDQLRGPLRKVFDYIVPICPTYPHNQTYRVFAKGDPGFIVCSPDAGKPEEIQELLGCCSDFFAGGGDTLIILDDCAVSKDLKQRSNKFIELAFSGRHKGISVWVISQQLTSVANPFRENVSCVVAFHNPSKTGTKTLFEDYGGSMDSGQKKKLIKALKENPYSRICFSLRDPYSTYLEIPSPEDLLLS